MTADNLADYLSGRGINVSRHGREYRVRCPIHDDPSASCDFRDGDNAVLVLCRAGCDTRDVIEAWGLAYSDVFYDAASASRANVPTAPANLPSEAELSQAVDRLANDRDMLAKLKRWRAWDDPDRLRKLGVGLTKRGRLLFPARRSDGRLVGVSEYDPNPDRPQGTPKTISTGERDLWPPPEFHRDGTGELWLTEGEPDAMTALMLGLTASGVPGAGWWIGRKGLMTAKRLARRERVYIVADCDEPGRESARRISASLAGIGVDCRVVDLDPTRADGWDLGDLRREAGKDETTRRFILGIAKDAQRVPPTTDANPPEIGWPSAMHEDAYVGLAGRIVREVEGSVEADRAAILTHFLVAFANAVGNRPHMVLGRRRHSCVLYALVVGRTAKARKGTAWAVVEDVMSRASPDWYTERVAAGLSSGEGLIQLVRDPVIENVRKSDGESHPDDEDDDDNPGYIRRVVDPGVEDKRLLVVEQEFAGPLRLMRREGNPLSQYLRTLWDSGKAAAIVKHSPTKTTGAHVSIVGHIVKDELEREMRSVDWYNGFANRFLFVCARRSRKLPEPPVVDPFKTDELALEVSIAIRNARDEANLLIFNADAQELWNEVYTGELSIDRSGVLGAVTARAEPYVARLAMVYALLDNDALIGVKHLRAALAVWRYCDASARFLFSAEGTIGADAERMREILAPAGKAGMTRTAIRDALQRNWNGDRIDAALAELKAAGLAEDFREDTGGRPVERWRLT